MRTPGTYPLAKGVIDLPRQHHRRRLGPAARWLGTAAVAALWLAASAVAQPTPAAADGASVAVVDFDFLPPTVTIAAGDTVAWTLTRANDPHTVTPFEPSDAFPASELLFAGDTYRVTFKAPGTYRYFCAVHPESMEGTVVVAGGSPSPAATPPEPTPAATATPAPTGSPSPGGSPGGPASDLVLLLVLAGVALGGVALLARRRLVAGRRHHGG